MEKLYIKFEEGNQESLDRACEEAERLGYYKDDGNGALDFEGHGILDCDIHGFYTTSIYREESLISVGYKEHIITNNNTMYKQGDILVNEDGDERKVLGVCGEVYFMSSVSDLQECRGSFTLFTLDGYGYKLKTDSPREVTMEEVECEKSKLDLLKSALRLNEKLSIRIESQRNEIYTLKQALDVLKR